MLHTRPELVSDGSNGDVACDSYRLYKEDARLASDLGLHFYRFSISWPRLLPTGFPNHISEDGKNYYSNLINELLDKGVEPVATLYHWDLPQKLQDLGGWTNPLIADWFADYARVAYSLFGDRVKTWITINEAVVICDGAYSHGTSAPGVEDPKNGKFLCNKHLILAHSKAWRVYDEEFRAKYHGKVSLANQLIWFEAFDQSSEQDHEAAELMNQYMSGRYSHPIYSKEGGWPSSIEEIIAENSKNEGYPRSRLPAFTREEIELVRGTYDFYGLNHYSSRAARMAKPNEALTTFFNGEAELGIAFGVPDSWDTAPGFFYDQAIYPEGFRSQLNWIKDNYGDIEVLVTENGFSTMGPGLDDDARIDYYSRYMNALLLAIEDGVNVVGYTVWTLLDNFEWGSGYEIKYGLHEVDFQHPDLRRTARKSAHYYASVIKANSLDVPLNPETWPGDES